MCVVSESLCFIAGTDFFFDLQYLEADQITPVDLTGATAVMQLLENTVDADEVLTFNGGITDAPNGLMRFSLTNAETQSVLPLPELKKTFVSDIQLTYTDLTKEVILRTTSTAEQGRTR